MKQGKHGGDIYKAAAELNVPLAEIRDYSGNVSHMQPQRLSGLNLPELLSVLPEPESCTLRKAYAASIGVSPENVCVTAGTTEAIEKICRLYSDKRANIAAPTYSDYEYFCRMYGISVKTHPVLAPADLCFICNPNNPTGGTTARAVLLEMIKTNPQTMFAVDESYMPFHVNEPDFTLKNHLTENLAVLRSFSKIFGVPGLRLGFVISGNEELIGRITGLMPPWNVNTAAQAAGMLLLNEDTSKTAAKTAKLKKAFLPELDKLGWIEPLESDVNFILCRLHGVTSADAFRKCFEQRVLIRDCANFTGLIGEHIRFSVRGDMQPLVDALGNVL
ncbi:aminotransferase class I/II-fold pyridoxal phosphate-dependent enzyme [Geovibrio thiophilus]|uniref:Aminotransferase n=1 Tax=Geovibrio thiophilus TaxID=139438 RepID=A0A410JZ62_9BACT|nr:aminotransferase class I/II-fold pyridoxal phosphate-dependent enzyme [Geovibrio thiophilus]QAR33454.1 aminotransferase class I/II-fold pyridoxal phosphate-dependent enzyme [Geovibrio thiophilus]